MKQLFLKLWAWFSGASITFLEFLAPIIASQAAALLEKLAPIALAVAGSLAESGKSGEEKRRQAVEDIKAAAVAQGIDASVSVINTAIELALLNLKAKGEVR